MQMTQETQCTSTLLGLGLTRACTVVSRGAPCVHDGRVVSRVGEGQIDAYSR